MDDGCSYLLGLVTFDDPYHELGPVPYLAVGPESIRTRRQKRTLTRDLLCALVGEGMIRASNSPFDVCKSYPPGWTAAIGPAKATVITPSGVVLVSEVDTRSLAGWREAVHRLKNELIVFYAVTDQLGVGDTPDLTKLERCATAGTLVGAVLHCTWVAVDP